MTVSPNTPPDALGVKTLAYKFEEDTIQPITPLMLGALFLQRKRILEISKARNCCILWIYFALVDL